MADKRRAKNRAEEAADVRFRNININTDRRPPRFEFPEKPPLQERLEASTQPTRARHEAAQASALDAAARAAADREAKELQELLSGTEAGVREDAVAAAKRAGTFSETAEFQKGFGEEVGHQVSGARAEALRRRSEGLRGLDATPEGIQRELKDIESLRGRLETPPGTGDAGNKAAVLAQSTASRTLPGQSNQPLQSQIGAQERGARSAALRRIQERQRRLNVPVTETL